MTYWSDSLVAMSQVDTPLAEGVSIRHLAPAGSLRGNHRGNRTHPRRRVLVKADAQGARDVKRETSCHVCQGSPWIPVRFWTNRP